MSRRAFVAYGGAPRFARIPAPVAAVVLAARQLAAVPNRWFAESPEPV